MSSFTCKYKDNGILLKGVVEYRW